MGSYNTTTGKMYSYKDIERLADKAGMPVLDFIDYLRYGESRQEGKLSIYNINEYHVAVQFY